MELRVLKYFLMVAREENITRAAQLLHVTQPTLSRQLKELEEELGVKLFTRGNHCIALTQDGLILRRRAQEIVELADKAARELAHGDEQLQGEIAIGSGETLSMLAIASAIASFHEMHPLVRYRMYSGNADNIKERLESGLLDIGLLSEPVDIAKYEFVRLDQREEWGVLTRTDSSLADREFVEPGDLAGRPLMVSERGLVRDELANWFGGLGDRQDVVLTYNLLYNAAMLVRQGLGEALCIRLNCQYDGLRFIPLRPELTVRSVVVWKRHQAASDAVGAFTAHIKKCLLSISEDSI